MRRPGFVVPLQTGVGIILTGPTFLDWQMRTGFNSKSPTALAPNRRASLSFEAVKPGIDFSL